jgi:hypothetical protein
VIDACVPWERRGGFAKVAQSDPDHLAAVAAKWSGVLYR